MSMRNWMTVLVSLALAGMAVAAEPVPAVKKNAAQAAPAKSAVAKPKGKVANQKASPGPGNSYQGERRHQTRQPPAQAHHQATANKPDQIGDEAQHGPISASNGHSP